MPSVTLIGPDGAGKTTLTRRLEASGLLPFRYLYMGVNIAASNVALPTSRLAERLKARSNASRAAVASASRTGPNLASHSTRRRDSAAVRARRSTSMASASLTTAERGPLLSRCSVATSASSTVTVILRFAILTYYFAAADGASATAG